MKTLENDLATLAEITRDKNKLSARVESLENEVIQLKAKLYDLMTQTN